MPSIQEAIPQGRWHLRPGESPSTKLTEEYPQLRGVEENAVFRYLLFRSRPRERLVRLGLGAAVVGFIVAAALKPVHEALPEWGYVVFSLALYSTFLEPRLMLYKTILEDRQFHRDLYLSGLGSDEIALGLCAWLRARDSRNVGIAFTPWLATITAVSLFVTLPDRVHLSTCFMTLLNFTLISSAILERDAVPILPTRFIELAVTKQVMMDQTKAPRRWLYLIWHPYLYLVAMGYPLSLQLRTTTLARHGLWVWALVGVLVGVALHFLQRRRRSKSVDLSKGGNDLRTLSHWVGRLLERVVQ